MATQAQINANRQNAQKSTGPRTTEGKAAVSQNAVKHGLFAVQDVLSVENQAEFDLMREEMLAELSPIGSVESLLAQRAVSLAWRLRRAEVMQNQVMECMIDSYCEEQRRRHGPSPMKPSESADFLPLGCISARDWSNSRVLEHLLVYERRIENSLYRTVAKLRAVQMLRQMAEPDAVPKGHAQAAAKENVAKQSQSVGAKSFSEGLPDRPSLSPKEMSSFIKETYGNNPPMWAQVTLRHLKEQAKSFQGSRVHGNGKKKRAVELSLLRL